MLATYNAHAFLPAIPSPLSPRSANVYGRRPVAYSFMSEPVEEAKSQDDTQQENTEPLFQFQPQPQQRSSSNAKPVPFSKRAIKNAPAPTTDELKERRREIFLRKVKDARDEKRFESRGEDIMRLTFLQQRRKWEDELSRSAPEADLPSSDDDLEGYEDQLHYTPTQMSTQPIPSSAMQISTQQSRAEDEIDAVLQQEDAELEALLSFMPDPNQNQVVSATDDVMSDHAWSDEDEDYDALFSELMDSEGMGEASRPSGALQDQSRAPDTEAMDMS